MTALKLRDFQGDRPLLDAIHAALSGAPLPADVPTVLAVDGVLTPDGRALAAEWGRSLKFQAWQRAAGEAFKASPARKAAEFAAFVDTLAS